MSELGARASGQGRIFQTSGNQYIQEHHHHYDAGHGRSALRHGAARPSHRPGRARLRARTAGRPPAGHPPQPGGAARRAVGGPRRTRRRRARRARHGRLRQDRAGALAVHRGRTRTWPGRLLGQRLGADVAAGRNAGGGGRPGCGCRGTRGGGGRAARGGRPRLALPRSLRRPLVPGPRQRRRPDRAGGRGVAADQPPGDGAGHHAARHVAIVARAGRHPVRPRAAAAGRRGAGPVRPGAGRRGPGFRAQGGRTPGPPSARAHPGGGASRPPAAGVVVHGRVRPQARRGVDGHRRRRGPRVRQRAVTPSGRPYLAVVLGRAGGAGSAGGDDGAATAVVPGGGSGSVESAGAGGARRGAARRTSNRQCPPGGWSPRCARCWITHSPNWSRRAARDVFAPMECCWTVWPPGCRPDSEPLSARPRHGCWNERCPNRGTRPLPAGRV